MCVPHGIDLGCGHSMQGSLIEGVHPYWLDCLHGGRRSSHPQYVTCMMHLQGYIMFHRMAGQRVSLSRGPQAVICKDKV